MPPSNELDWDDLRYFLRAVQAKTLAGAARAMGVEHTTIGRRLSSLERALGAPLVLRGPEGLRLTPLGDKLVPLVEEAERAVLAVRELAMSEKARVRLAVPSGFTKYFAAGVADLVRENPGLTLEIVSGAHAVDLKKGEADLAVRGGPIADNDFVARKLGASGFALYGSETYLARRPAPSDTNDLTGHDLIGFDASLSAVPAAKWLAEHGAKGNVVLRSREMSDMLSATLEGVGLAVLPCALADEEPTLRRLTHAVVASHTLTLVYRGEKRVSKDVRAVIRFVLQVMQENAGRIAGLRSGQ
jgi:DNA-binding transcriptional LysR family regulator